MQEFVPDISATLENNEIPNQNHIRWTGRGLDAGLPVADWLKNYQQRPYAMITLSIFTQGDI